MWSTHTNFAIHINLLDTPDLKALLPVFMSNKELTVELEGIYLPV